MSSRVTRSSAKKSADSSSSASLDSSIHNQAQPEPPPPPQPSRKRKASRHSNSAPTAQDPSTQTQPSSPKPKRIKSKQDSHAPVPVEPVKQKTTKSKKQASTIMPTSPSEESPTSPSGPSSSSKRKPGKAKKLNSPTEPSSSSAKPSSKTSRPSKKRGSSGNKPDSEVKSDEPTSPDSLDKSTSPREDVSDEPPPPPRGDGTAFLEEALGGNPFGRSTFGGLGGFAGMASYMSDIMNQTRGLLNSLKANNEPDIQLEALRGVSEMLLMSNEDNLNGQFNADAFAKEFVRLASFSPGDDPELAVYFAENPEILPQMRLLSCRCIANLIEALPSASGAVVYNGAVPILIAKLVLSDDFDIELAEQALTTLQKISSEFPSAIVREGGLNALLQNLDFFTSSVQRTAVTAAANCCRNIPEDAFSTIKEFMPRLRDVLNSSDQNVVEQGSLCVTRIFDSFKGQDDNIEQLMDAELLKVILRLLLPGSANFISAHIHTQFLRVLSATARASSILTKELFKMDVTDTLYQILTGVSAPSQEENVASNIDSVVVMQALIHRPRDQVFETLKVICELLPAMDANKLGYLNELTRMSSRFTAQPSTAKSNKGPIDKRMKLLRDCKKEMKRFATILFPTLTDAYSSTVNLQVRQHVLDAQLKMLCNFDLDVLEEALRPVPYASHLASILSQQDHTSLVTSALQAAELLIQRLGHVYRYQFYREGVIAEVRKLANRPIIEKAVPSEPSKNSSKAEKAKAGPETAHIQPQPPSAAEGEEPPFSPGDGMSTSVSSDHERNDEEELVHDEDQDEDEEAEAIEADVAMDDEDDDDDEGSSEDSDNAVAPPQNIVATDLIQDLITRCAKKFIDQTETQEGAELREKASQALDDLNNLVQNIADSYANEQSEEGAKLFSNLARSFEGDALESITSYELLSSKVVHTLVDIFDASRGQSNQDARVAFVEAFMGRTASTNVKKASTASPSTPFSILVQKLQDLLSRSEHFEVITVNSNAHDNNRSSPSSALSKHIRIRLVAEGEESGISSSFRTIMVSIHAIATLKALDEYLRPRIASGERTRTSRAPGTAASVPGPALAEAMRTVPGSRELFLSRRLASTPNPLTGPSYPPAASARSSSARGAPKTPRSADESETIASPSSTSTPRPRRSARKTRSQPVQPSTPPASGSTPSLAPPDSQTTIECADEAQMSDEDEDLDPSELMADVNDALAGSPPEPEPSAVNVDVTPSGAVTTREENDSPTPALAMGTGPFGSRSALFPPIPPNMPPHLARQAERFFAARGLPLPLAQRASSYAAAAASTPTDWHLEFMANGRPIPPDMTIYKAIHTNATSPDDLSGRSMWMNTHTIQFKKIPGPPPNAESLSSRPVTPPVVSSSLPESLENNPVTGIILRLLRILHEINGTLDELLSDKSKTLRVSSEPPSQFVNTKLTAKMNRQLEEPLIVASRSLPSWSEDLARISPFLFPFETRYLFLQSTSFGYGRCMQRWLTAQDNNDSRHRHRDDRPMLGRIQRQKVRIQRHRFLESAVKVMEAYGSNNSILEVEYFEEVGTGLGPTLEFYSSASKEFCKKKLKLWRENESDHGSEYAFGKQGLFPMPMSAAQLKSLHGEKVLKLFNALGKFVARSMLDSRIIDISFNPLFFRWGRETKSMPQTIGTLKVVDEDLAKSLMTLKQFDLSRKKVMEQTRLTDAQKHLKLSGIRVANATIEDLSLNFTLPGYADNELVPRGKSIDVDIHNVGDYVERVIDYTLYSGVQSQIQSFRKGFSEVFAYNALRAFTPDELVMLFGRVEEDWSMETLTDSIKADHGYNLDSKSVRNLLQAMTEFNAQERRDFLQFVTGSPKLPIGGFKSLTPMFTVVLRPSEPGHHADEYLPSCMTCVNYLKLPDYSDLEVMKTKLGVATQEGQGAFHLS
ncbi:MAG: hypothetical protein Q9159_001429 [Coniocarpon cinnabarinum]